MSDDSSVVLALVFYAVGLLLTFGAFAVTPQALKARYGDTEPFYTWLRRRTLGGMLGLLLLLAGTATLAFT